MGAGEVFCSPPSQTRSTMRVCGASRRLADSNCWKVLLRLALPHGEWIRCPLPTEFVTRTTASVTTAGAAPPPAQEERHQRCRDNCGSDLARGDRRDGDRRHQPACLRARAHHRDLAQRVRVAGARRDRPAGIRLEPMRGLPEQARLQLRRQQLVRDPAGEPMPDSVARPARRNVACPSALADPVHPRTVRVAEPGARVPAARRLLLTGGRA